MKSVVTIPSTQCVVDMSLLSTQRRRRAGLVKLALRIRRQRNILGTPRKAVGLSIDPAAGMVTIRPEVAPNEGRAGGPFYPSRPMLCRPVLMRRQPRRTGWSR